MRMLKDARSREAGWGIQQGFLNNVKWIREVKLRRILKKTAEIVVKRLLVNFKKAVTPQ